MSKKRRVVRRRGMMAVKQWCKVVVKRIKRRFFFDHKKWQAEFDKYHDEEGNYINNIY